MRPKIRFLSDDLILKIISEAKEILCTLGMEIHNEGILSLLSDSGAKTDMDKSHVVFTENIINKALETVPDSFKLSGICCPEYIGPRFKTDTNTYNERLH